MSSDVQKDLLKKLEDYGNSVVGSYSKKTRTKRLKKTSAKKARKELKGKEVKSKTKGSKSRLSKKKQARSQKDKDELGDLESEEDSLNSENKNPSTDEPTKKRKKQLEQLKMKLGLTKKDFAAYARSHKKEDTKSTAIITAAGKPKREPEVIVFLDPAKRRDREQASKKSSLDPRRRESITASEDLDKDTFDMRVAKFDVHQFAIKGMAKGDKESAQILHAIKLGAEPKKRAYVNYKALMESKKKDKELLKAAKQMERHMGYKESAISSKTVVSGKGKNRKRRRRPDNVLTKDGQIGQFKEGIQFISHKQIENVNKLKSGRR